MDSKKLLPILVLALSVLLGACGTLGDKTGSKDFTLLVTSSDTQQRIAQQQWQIQQGDKHYSLEVVVERNANDWRWIMLNNLGQRLATVETQDGQIHIERLQSHPANQLLPALLQAWQFSYWPLADLQASQGWVFVAGDGRREARFSGILRASIEYRQPADGTNPWLGSLSYNTREFRLLVHSQPLN